MSSNISNDWSNSSVPAHSTKETQDQLVEEHSIPSDISTKLFRELKRPHAPPFDTQSLSSQHVKKRVTGEGRGHIEQSVMDKAQKILGTSEGREERISHTINFLKNFPSPKITVDTRKIQSDLDVLPKKIASMIQTLDSICLSRGHDLEYNTYPTPSDFAPITDGILEMQQLKNGCKAVGTDASNLFHKQFSQFFTALVTKLRDQALLSRRSELEQLKNQDQHKPNELEFKIAVTTAHIEALEQKPMQPLLELRDLLNLSRMDQSNVATQRVPTMQEQRAFKFLLSFFESVPTDTLLSPAMR